MSDRAQLLEDFKKDGFVRIKGFINTAEMDEIEAHVIDVIQNVVPTLEKKDAMHEDYDRPETLKQVTIPSSTVPELVALQASPKMTGIVESLLEDKARAHSLELFIKPPMLGTPTPPHQDGYYFCLVPNHALTCWLALDDMDSENGTLRYVAGSHKAGVLPHGASNVLGFSQGVSAGDLTGIGTEVNCHVKRGDMLVHHSLTVHSADGNPSSRLRRALGMVYFAKSAKVDPELQQRYLESVQRQRESMGVQ